MPIIYLDEVLAINFIVDYLIISGAAALAGKVIKHWRAAAAAGIGAVYAALVCIYKGGVAATLPFQVLISAIMILVSCGFNTELFKMFLCFAAISFVFGGAVLSIECIVGQNQSNMPLIKVNFRLLVAAVGLCWAVIKLVFDRYLEKHSFTREIQLAITLDGITHKLAAIYDSGNRIKDPITGKSAVIVDRFVAAEWFPENVSSVIRSLNCSAEQMLESLGDSAKRGKFGLIPYRTVAENGLMLTFRADSVNIDGKASECRLIGLAPNKLSGDGSIKALVG